MDVFHTHEGKSILTNRKQNDKGFSYLLAIGITATYMIGTGFVTIPWAFYEGGIVLSSITMIVVLVLCNTTKNYVLTVMARAEEITSSTCNYFDSENVCEKTAIKIHDMHVISEDEDLEVESIIKYSSYGSADCASNDNSRHDDVEVVEDKSTIHTIDTESTSCGNTVEIDAYSHIEENSIDKSNSTRSINFGNSIDSSKNLKLVIKERKFEYTELCRLFMGKTGETSYLIAVAVNMYLQLWGYTNVFSSAMAVALPIKHSFDYDYGVYTLAYALVVIPLSCIELKEQVASQLALSFIRFSAIFLMIFTVIYAMSIGDDATSFSDMGSHVREHSELPLVDFKNFHQMLAVLVYLALFHNGIPVLAQPVADKTKLSSIMMWAIAIVGGSCWVLGIVVAFYFGPHIATSENINWNTYVGGTGRAVYLDDDKQAYEWIGVKWWAFAIRVFIVCVPALNILSHPSYAIVLGNNLLVGIGGSPEIIHSNKWKVFFRLWATIPPIIGAMFVKDIGIIASYAGVLSQVTAITFPSILFIRSKQMVDEKLGPKETYYDGLGSSTSVAWVIFVLSITTVIYTMWMMVTGS
mmetsp:Transcript_19661/g.27643  ORF Transcript_19661/g.27643 Transcript_19661/m.27643 type:complete len:581 (+) Transcript_19661:20-1762(+)